MLNEIPLDILSALYDCIDGRVLMNLYKTNQNFRNFILKNKNEFKSKTLRLETTDNPAHILKFLEIFPIQVVEVGMDFTLPEKTDDVNNSDDSEESDNDEDDEMFSDDDEHADDIPLPTEQIVRQFLQVLDDDANNIENENFLTSDDDSETITFKDRGNEELQLEAPHGKNQVNKIKFIFTNNVINDIHITKFLNLFEKVPQLIWQCSNNNQIIEIDGGIPIPVIKHISKIYSKRQLDIKHVILCDEIVPSSLNSICRNAKTVTFARYFPPSINLRIIESVSRLNFLLGVSFIQFVWNALDQSNTILQNLQKINFTIYDIYGITNRAKSHFDEYVPECIIFPQNSTKKSLKFSNLVCFNMYFLVKLVENNLTKLKLVFAATNPSLNIKLIFHGHVALKLEKFKMKKLVIVDTHIFTYMVSNEKQWLWIQYLFYLLPNVSELHYIYRKSLNLNLDNVLAGMDETKYKKNYSELTSLYQYIEYQQFIDKVRNITATTEDNKTVFLRTIFKRKLLTTTH